MSPARSIAFLSDYGLEDEFVGVCHAVIEKISPGTTVIDLTHAVPPQNVLMGAIFLMDALRFLPPEAVVLAVVDPGVGTARRAIAVETRSEKRLMVGPDNGLLSLAWAELDGVSSAVEISSPAVVLQPISATFHGRDMFAPAAAHLARGLPMDEVGPPVDPETLVTISLPAPKIAPGSIQCEVVSTDRFGNVQLSARVRDLTNAGLDGAAFVLLGRDDAEIAQLPVVRTFGDVPGGGLALIGDSSGWLEVVVNRGSAEEMLGLAPGDAVTLVPARA